MLVNLKENLEIAERGEFALPAFNVYNMETVIGIIEAAEEAKAPVIIQTYSRLFENREAYYLAPMALAAAKKASVPVCFHLDHGSGYPAVAKAIQYGCTGVMIDASKYPLEENIAVTKTVADICNALNVPVEGELGHIGSAANGDETAAEYTKVDEAVRFVKETNVACLAIMVGTAHGHYKKAPVLAIDRIREIKEATKLPLVLHGGSGIPDDQIRAAIKAGIRKVNFGTDVCFSFLDNLFATERTTYAVDLFMKQAVEGVKQFALEKIRLLGAEGKA